MKMNIFKNKTAFTLVEVIVSVGIVTVMLGGIYQVFIMGSKSWQAGSGLVSLQENARNMIIYFTKDIRQSTESISNTTLINNGDTLTFGTSGGTVTYLLATVPDTDIKQLQRNNQPVGMYVSSIDLVRTGLIVDITVNTQSDIPFRGIKNYTLTGKVKVRNE
ncbi:MAG: prepilin-type N-terminal cleavage/methylation domain-containing protein [Candidatus Omnitrophota bacterium]|nr:MAG: prepilin-type N-terminal cleavage/methylation domain-containing protein [Candidatus Omnitrophota bacterium]